MAYECFSNSPLHRFDLGGVAVVVHGSSLAPESIISPSGAGCGLTNHPNGALYSNTLSGAVKLDATTGAVLAGPFGVGGDGLGITVDPQTGNVLYVAGDGSIESVTPSFSSATVFSTVTAGDLVDGIAFDPTGNFLFLSNRAPTLFLTILDRAGALVRNVPLTHEPDGISFHATTPKFVLTNNTDGTIVRFDFPAADFTAVPVQSLFASGGFRGDLTQVGPDGCVYLTQDGTRYDDGTTDGNNSVVRICPGFAPPPGVGTSLTDLSPVHAWVGLKNSDDVGTRFDLLAEVLKNGTPVASGLTRCLNGLARNPASAQEAIVAFGSFPPVTLASGDVIALRLSTRIGTNPDGTKCMPGPGSSHNSAVGLRLYYDAASRKSRFDATITPAASADEFLHSDGSVCGSTESTGVTAPTIDTTAPAAVNPRCKDSGAVNFAGTNPYAVIGVWSMAAVP